MHSLQQQDMQYNYPTLLRSGEGGVYTTLTLPCEDREVVSFGPSENAWYSCCVFLLIFAFVLYPNGFHVSKQG